MEKATLSRVRGSDHFCKSNSEEILTYTHVITSLTFDNAIIPYHAHTKHAIIVSDATIQATCVYILHTKFKLKPNSSSDKILCNLICQILIYNRT